MTKQHKQTLNTHNHTYALPCAVFFFYDLYKAKGQAWATICTEQSQEHCTARKTKHVNTKDTSFSKGILLILFLFKPNQKSYLFCSYTAFPARWKCLLESSLNLKRHLLSADAISLVLRTKLLAPRFKT